MLLPSDAVTIQHHAIYYTVPGHYMSGSFQFKKNDIKNKVVYIILNKNKIPDVLFV